MPSLSPFRVLVPVLVLVAAVAACLPWHALSAASPHQADAVADFLDHSGVERQAAADRARSDDVEHWLHDWARAGLRRPALDQRLAQHAAIPADVATQLVDLTFLRVEAGVIDERRPDPAPVVRRYLDLLRAHPRLPLLQDEAARAVATLQDCDGRAFDKIVAAVGGDAAALRRRLRTASGCVQALAAAPEDAALLQRIARATDFYGQSVLHLALLRLADARIDALPPDRRASLRADRIRTELRFGDRDAAVAALPAVDDPLFAGVRDALDGDDRRAVAAAFWLAGRRDDAQRWRDLAEALPPPRAGVPIGVDAADAARRAKAAEADAGRRDQDRQRLDRALHPDTADPFALLIAPIDSNAGYDANVWRPFNAALAVREGYPGLGRVPARGPGFDADEIREAVAACHRCPADVLAAIRAIGDAGTVAASSASTLSAPAAGDLPDAILARMAQQIAAVPDWQVQPLPAAMRTPKARPRRSDDEAGDVPPAPAWAERLPAGELVRHARAGHRIVAITASQSLDPVGEVGAGGYWVSVSEDDGETFAPPLYTGLHTFSPYVVRSVSKLPLLDGDVLRIEVAVRRVDPEKIVFPPIGLPIAESRDDLFLSIPLAELRRDTDGDGLTDLAERAMLLDPAVADTDGDGLGDAIDALPQVPQRLGADARGEALSVALNRILGTSLGAIVTTSAHAGGDPTQTYALGTGTDAHHDAGATFLVAPAAGFAHLALRERVVLLTPAQADTIAKVRGVFLPIRITLFEVSHAGDQGLLEWTAGWTGGTLRLKRVDGAWVAEEIDGWIT